jgi:hypothetical protein
VRLQQAPFQRSMRGEMVSKNRTSSQNGSGRLLAGDSDVYNKFRTDSDIEICSEFGRTARLFRSGPNLGFL